MVKAGAYLLGEFGFTLIDGEVGGGAPIPGVAQFAAIHQHFPRISTSSKALVLSAYVKLANLYPELRDQTGPIFAAFTTAMDAELQQRALEYGAMPSLPESVTSVVLDALPPFPDRGSQLEARLAKGKQASEDKDVWQSGASKGGSADNGGEGEGEAAAQAAPSAIRAPAAVSSSPAASGGGGFDDLLGMDSAPAPAPAPAAPVDAASVPVTTRVGITDQAAAARAYAAALTKAGGVLYEDQYVQIGVKRAFTGADGKVTLFVGNKTAVPLVTFKMRVVAAPALRAEVDGGAASIPTTVAPRAQVSVAVTVESMQPFTEPPALQLSFISVPGTGHAYALKLPVAAHSFCEPVALPPADYKTRWGALAGAPREVTAIVTPASGSAAVTMAAASDALAKISMAAIEAGAPGATGACTFRTHSTGPTGAYISVGCLAMVIPDANAGVFKVAVRTQHGDVSAALMAVLKPLLEGL